MKSEIIGKNSQNPNSYPVLKIHKEFETVVLFISPNTGTCVHSDHHILGDYLESEDGSGCQWDEKNFVIFNGEVKLSN